MTIDSNPANQLELLTEDEHEAIKLAGELANLLKRIVAGGITQQADIVELITPIHVIQRAIMSQAAGRAYPKKYRLLGETL